MERIQKKDRAGMSMSKGGRPSKLTPTDKRQIRRIIMTGKVGTATELARQLKTDTNIVLSPKKVGCALKEGGHRAL